jgi:uncharacterized membrane protein (DUF373 family)
MVDTPDPHPAGKWSFARQWRGLSHYQRFESGVALVLTYAIALIIVVALYRLTVSVVSGLLFGVFNPLDQKAFQLVFGQIMTLLIALEFNHTLQYVVRREQSVIQTKVVLLIALLALARKFIILDVDEMTSGRLLGLAATTLSLGASYWLLRGCEEKETRDTHG